jgi:Fur family transcriptional regulator, ferric uptake regulator
MPDISAWIAALERAGYFVTLPRQLVAELVVDQDGHFTASELLLDARRRRLKVGRATVFRALEVFDQLGLVERIDLPDRGHAYVVCQPAHHHHVVCTRCGRSSGVADLGIAAVARAVEAETGFEVDSHRIELYGLCPVCRLEAPRTTGGRPTPLAAAR